MPSDILKGKEAELVGAARAGKACSAFGLPFGARIFLAAALAGAYGGAEKKPAEEGAFVLYVTPDAMSAVKARDALSALCPPSARDGFPRDGFPRGGCALIADGVDFPPPFAAARRVVAAERLASLFALATNRVRAAAAPVSALLSGFPDRGEFLGAAVRLSVGADIRPEAVAAALAAAGYARVELTEARGQFSLRGDILDIFDIGSDAPVRVDFFGDTVESVKIFSPETGLSGDALPGVEICPASDGAVAGIEEYLPPNSAVVWDDCKRVSDAARAYLTERAARFGVGAGTKRTDLRAEGLRGLEELAAALSPFKKLAFHTLNSGAGVFRPEAVFSFRPAPPFRYQNDFDSLSRDVKNWRARDYTVVLAAGDDDRAALLRKGLTEAGITPAIKKTLAEAADGGLSVVPSAPEDGFILHDSRFVLVGRSELFRRPRRIIKRRSGRDVFTEAAVGDYVVHDVHGIGRCEGITRLKGPAFGEKDYIIVSYKGGDRLYVPAEAAGSLARYSGGAAAPPLNKIGGEDFARVVKRARESVKKLAFDLRALYGERAAGGGIKLGGGDGADEEFAASFPYDETEDQARAISETLADMRSGRIMDRLVCGDAGNGKTEVALRAAYAAAAAGYQTAFIAPTGILSEQHYNNARARFEAFGVRVARLNRFAPPAEVSRALEGLASGQIDAVCGTHRVLSADVKFKNLGLLILDEEQRFGVGDKDKIKLLRKNVHALALTATPIPRTLHMSLTGIRDISVIETPPEGRVPAQTYVAEYSDALAADAASREIARGGQVFIVFNRIDRIYAYAEEIRALLPPGTRVAVAHGRMAESELEDAVRGFYGGESDVLISTTIIENGIDLPRANTIIVYGADAFGLSQLYQLRGRVGRGDRTSYAYFTYEGDKVLTETACKRLEAVLEFTDGGSGFKIAMRDLEIRGAGEVLGARQHGHMEKIGYEMYGRLLSEAAAELGGVGRVAETLPDTKTECDLDAYIPDGYISDDAGRMRLYRRIGESPDPSARAALVREITDVYGPPPPPVLNLINLGAARALGMRAGAVKLVMRRDGGMISFDSFRRVNDAVAAAVRQFGTRCYLKADPPSVIFKGGNVYENVVKFLLAIQPA